jgi:hypothetical protein
MIIHLSDPLQNSIQAAVHSGRFASVNDAMIEAASMLVERLRHEQAQQQPSSQKQPPADEKPIWEEILELTVDVPDEEWDKLPPDLAEEHDHYIYGIPKRSTA